MAAARIHLLPSLPLPPPGGYNAIQLVGIVAAFYLFLVARPMDDIGYTFLLERRGYLRAGLAFAAYAVVALPLGGQPLSHVAPAARRHQRAVAPVIIYLMTAVPEEFLFRD